jgi:hypothetical protein
MLSFAIILTVRKREIISKQLLPLIIHVSFVYVITPKGDQEGMADNLSHEYQLENSMIGERKVITKNKLEFC